MSLKLRERKTTTDRAEPSYTHSPETLKYIRKHGLIDPRFVKDMPPGAVQSVMRRHRKKCKFKRLGRVVIWGVILSSGVFAWQRYSSSFDLPEFSFSTVLDRIKSIPAKISSSEGGGEMLSDSKETVGSRTKKKSSEHKELEAKLGALIVEPVGSEEDSFGGPRWSR